MDSSRLLSAFEVLKGARESTRWVVELGIGSLWRGFYHKELIAWMKPRQHCRQGRLSRTTCPEYALQHIVFSTDFTSHLFESLEKRILRCVK